MVEVGDLSFYRIDLLAMLFFIVVGFGVIRALNETFLDRIFARPLLYAYALVASGASLISAIALSGGLALAVLTRCLIGVSCSFLLTAWGRSFGCAPTTSTIPEVFLGSLIAAFLCVVFSLVEVSSPALLAVCALPFASVVNMEIPISKSAQTPAAVEYESNQVRELSFKILAGTFLFGMAAGMMELYSIDPVIAVPYYPVSMVVFGSFLIGGLSLLFSDGFGRGAELNKSYRLAVFIMVIGVLLVPVPLFSSSILTGQAIVLSGYLGLEVVLISLFVVMAEITATGCAQSFSAGFLSLFAGEFIGAVLSNAVLRSTPPEGGDSFAIVALSGAIILFGYIFLFTERDFDTLSQIVSESDSFERTCEEIVKQYGLSNRESDILAFALRGRTSERIAQEFVISKSTVDTHLRRIYAKCDVHSRQELLDLAERISSHDE